MDLIGQQPRYKQLAQALLNDIRDGKYKVGDLLPTEHALCTEFGASRFTVRQALRQMTQMGMVTRQPGVGTRLISLETGAVYRQGLEQVSDILQYAADTELHVIASRPVKVETEDLREFLQASKGQEWLQIEAIRRAPGNNDKPICFTEIFLPPAFRTVRGLEGRVGDAVYRLINAQFGEETVEVRQEIRAGTLSRKLADLLSARPGAACLWIIRYYLNARGEAVEVTRSAHPGDRFQYQQVFRQKE
ncbi:GntR family transcriptional regulator [Nitratireductor pacificus]|uniref:GntR family transcriptional regulator n=1 Tax=Nitratireductor pacificus pht-3B TaxID=391937 RepID=K2MSW0_9HYPH|nr:GntR family transcriptional regulator [Nitratireductor pacificus]EKF20467.1 GntR family transcriptional regulator [Nitratireductor pacificus pht-3B]